MARAGTSSENDRPLDEVVISIFKKFSRKSLPSDCCIFTIPERIRRSNEEAYTPRTIAIGPYHRHQPNLKPMEDHKLLYLQHFFKVQSAQTRARLLKEQADNLEMKANRLRIERFEMQRFEMEANRLKMEANLEMEANRLEMEANRLEMEFCYLKEENEDQDNGKDVDEDKDNNHDRVMNEQDCYLIYRLKKDDDVDYHDDDNNNPMKYRVNLLQDCMEIVKSLEDGARSYYDKKIQLNPNEFAEMMLIDGIFMIQIFLMFSFCNYRLPGDRIMGRPYILDDVRRDMTLLENQIPFFVIVKLFKKAFGKKHQFRRGVLLGIMYDFFYRLTQVEGLPEVATTKVEHIVDALRLSFLPLMNEASDSSDELDNSNERINFCPRATELVAAGVKLRKGKSKCFLDIKFKDGVLEIPHLVLYDKTESFFRNIIAFEQLYYRGKTRNLFSYIAFMDHLVDSPADTELLMDNGIIENWLSNKKAATDLINSFCKEISMLKSERYFHDLSTELNKHCQRPCNKWKAILKRDYCSNPWVVISVIAAVVLLLLTGVQTLCSVLSVA